jgi:CRP-like cAMP-binding protein
MDVSEMTWLLGRTPLFRRLDEATRGDIVTGGQWRVLEKGSTVFAQGQAVDRLFVLLRGVVKQVVHSPRGDVVELARLRSPATFGEVAALDGLPSSASAEAVTDCVLLSVTAERMRCLLRADADMRIALLHQFGELVRQANRLAIDRVFLPTTDRVVRKLLDLYDADEVGGPQYVTQTELAHMVGGVRQTVNQVLRQLEGRQWIKVAHGQVEILKPDELRRRINSRAAPAASPAWSGMPGPA